MRLVIYTVVAFVFMTLQTTVLPAILPLYFKPDLLLILVVYVGLSEGLLRGGAFSYFLGCLQDVYAGGYTGLYGLAFLALFLVVRRVVVRLNTENPLLLLMLVSVGTLLQTAVLLFALGFFADMGALWVIILKGLLPQILLNLAAAFLLIRFTSWLQRRFGPRFKLPGLRLDRRYGY